MFVLVAIVLLIVLPSPWNVIGCAASLVAFVFEVAYWQRKVRGRRTEVGAETLIGTEGTVVRDCRPDGQVRVRGELWEATSPGGADRGDVVTVLERRELTLVVERRASSA